MRVIGYERVSTHDQAEHGYGLAAQVIRRDHHYHSTHE